MIENNHIVAQGSGCDEVPMSKGNQKILGSDGTALYLNWVDVTQCTCLTMLKRVNLLYVNYPSINLTFKNYTLGVFTRNETKNT